MSTHRPARVLYVVVCGAGPAADIDELLTPAIAADWDPHVIATLAGLPFIDQTAIEARTGHRVRAAYRDPTQPRQSLPPADAIIVAPATFNTINKLAAGISDTYALGVLAECIGAGVPVVIVPFVNTSLAVRSPFRNAVQALREEGVHVLLGDSGFHPHPPRTGGARKTAFPWQAALAHALQATEAGQP